MASVWQQQVFALDARYNANRAPNHPTFRTLYIRRRSQLLRSQGKVEDSSIRKHYIKLRNQLLQQRYGPICTDQGSLRSRSLSIRSTSRISESPDNTRIHGKEFFQTDQGVVPTRQAEASRAIVGGNSISENYAFVGVHYIFDQHKDAVTMVKFANNDKSKLCCASLDGTVSICNVIVSPPQVEILRGHKKGVTGCDWSVSNDLIVTCSLDATLCLWNVASRTCLRIVRDQLGSEILACLFQPANNNMVIAGNGKGLVQVVNVSTGIYARGGSSKIGGRVLCLAADSSGQILWAGNDKGAIFSFMVEGGSGRIVKCRRFLVSENSPVTCLSWRAWISREARDPSLLVNVASNAVCLFRVTNKQGNLQLRKKFFNRHKNCLIRSTFCPIMSFRQGACVVTGSEDCCVVFLDIERDAGASSCVNKLLGHASPVLGVSFDCDESLLATSDLQGLVIVWTREKMSSISAQ